MQQKLPRPWHTFESQPRTTYHQLDDMVDSIIPFTKEMSQRFAMKLDVINALCTTPMSDNLDGIADIHRRLHTLRFYTHMLDNELLTIRDANCFLEDKLNVLEQDFMRSALRPGVHGDDTIYNAARLHAQQECPLRAQVYSKLAYVYQMQNMIRQRLEMMSDMHNRDLHGELDHTIEQMWDVCNVKLKWAEMAIEKMRDLSVQLPLLPACPDDLRN